MFGFVHDALILYKGRIYLLPSSPLIAMILSGYHDCAHERVQKTSERVHNVFYWKALKSNIAEYVAACPIWQCHKSENLSLTGLLQPLTLPSQIWADISMDFIDGRPKVWGKTILFVVVDRFSKYAHLFPWHILIQLHEWHTLFLKILCGYMGC